ncbi:hypothetical protein R80B4_00519 [Fibrobacteres bacterium R8-0-B4]
MLALTGSKINSRHKNNLSNCKNMQKNIKRQKKSAPSIDRYQFKANRYQPAPRGELAAQNIPSKSSGTPAPIRAYTLNNNIWGVYKSIFLQKTYDPPFSPSRTRPQKAPFCRGGPPPCFRSKPSDNGGNPGASAANTRAPPCQPADAAWVS